MSMLPTYSAVLGIAGRKRERFEEIRRLRSSTGNTEAYGYEALEEADAEARIWEKYAFAIWKTENVRTDRSDVLPMLSKSTAWAISRADFNTPAGRVRARVTATQLHMIFDWEESWAKAAQPADGESRPRTLPSCEVSGHAPVNAALIGRNPDHPRVDM